MAKFFESKEYSEFVRLAKILAFAEDLNNSNSARQRQFDKPQFNLFVDDTGDFRLYKGGRTLLTGSVQSDEDKARLIEASRDETYKTLEDWVASRVAAAATYRRLAEERMEAAQKELAQFAGLEAELLRGLHDLQKTKKIAKEGHQ